MRASTIVLTLACIGCGSSTLAPSALAAAPSASVSASPSQGSAPLAVHFTLDLQNVSDIDAQYYCPTVTWTFGDGLATDVTPTCEAYNGQVPQKRYAMDHTYRAVGDFPVTVQVKKGGAVLLSGTAKVSAR